MLILGKKNSIASCLPSTVYITRTTLLNLFIRCPFFSTSRFKDKLEKKDLVDCPIKVF